MRYYDITPVKTYASKINVEKAVKKVIPNFEELNVVWTILTTEPMMSSEPVRYFPVFFGTKALEQGIHFKFNVVAF